MPAKLRAGDILYSRYKIIRIIGQGGVGCVYLAEDIRLEGRLCAIKEVDYESNLPAGILRQSRQQFQREATVLARLDHTNLPKVSDFFSDGGNDYLVMDFVPGKDLNTLMLEAEQQNTFLPERDTLGWASQIADALLFLHSRETPILHRDIKPSNIKLTPEGLIKLVDFGLVKIQVPDEMTVTVIQGRGTALYTPLEQYGGDAGHTDTRSDIYSFGATLYHLLTNELTADARQRFLHADSLPPIREINPHVSPRTERAVLWAMELHPDDRPQSIIHFRQALLGDWDPPRRKGSSMPAPTFADLIASPVERTLIWTSLALLIFSFLATLGK